MASTPNLTPAAAGKPHPPLRLLMKPAGAARGFVDGGWWPRSHDPAAEFPALVAALAARVGAVSRVSYHLDIWHAVARRLLIQGRLVRFEGFRSIDPHTVEVVGSDGGRVSLLVVPPGIPEEVANAVLHAAARTDSTARVTDILVTNGVAAASAADSEVTR